VSYQTIYYWPNNYWCYKGDVHNHMSDDYATKEVPDSMTYEQIDALVDTLVYFGE